jgi:hypothetical protein
VLWWEQGKNKEIVGLNAYYEGFGGGWCVADKYLCTFPLCSTTNVISEGIWDLLDTSDLHGLCSANFLRVSDGHWTDGSLSRKQSVFLNQVNGFLFVYNN